MNENVNKEQKKGCTRIAALCGKKYGLLTVIAFVKDTTPPIWRCLCACGKEAEIQASNIRSGHTKSCGCLRRVVTTKHGMANSPTYKSWQAMKSRCCNSNTPNYKYYGERGITIYLPWITSFEQFYVDMGKRPSSSYSLDRKDTDGDYTPDNCRWATASEQQLNKRRFISPKTRKYGKLSMPEIAAQAGCSLSTLERHLSGKRISPKFGAVIDKVLAEVSS